MKNAHSVITKNILNFTAYYDETSADLGLHVVIGKIGLAAELDLIDNKDMGVFIDLLFFEHSKVKK